jgi:hypothetical protein
MELKIHLSHVRDGVRGPLCYTKYQDPEKKHRLTGDPDKATCRLCLNFLDKPKRGRPGARINPAPEGPLSHLFRRLYKQWRGVDREQEDDGSAQLSRRAVDLNWDAVWALRQVMLQLSMEDRDQIVHALRTLVELAQTVAGDADIDMNWVSNMADRLETTELVVFEYDGRGDVHEDPLET